MNFFETILWGQSATAPKTFGFWHLLAIGLVIAACVVIFIFRKHFNEKRFLILLAGCLATVVLFEIGKQIHYSYNPETKEWKYDWGQFPFQFCSSPYYIWPAILLIRHEKIRKGLYAFLGTFNLFGGLIFMLVPDGNLKTYVFISTQTLTHHGLMVVVGVAAYLTGRIQFKWDTALHATPYFGMLVAVAILLNATIGMREDIWFNAFYISTYRHCPLPILRDIYPHVHPVFFIALYIVGFIVIAHALLFAAWGISLLYKKCKEWIASKKQANQTQNDG